MFTLHVRRTIASLLKLKCNDQPLTVLNSLVIYRSGHNFIIQDLPSVLIIIIADQMLNDLLCCSNK